MYQPKFVTVFILLSVLLSLFGGLNSFGSAADCTVVLNQIELDTARDEVRKKARDEALVDIEKEGSEFVYKGLSPRGIQILSQAHDELTRADQLVNSRVFELESVVNTTRIVQVGKWNEAVLGPPGGSKTGLFLMMIPNLWVKQVHAMMNEVPLIGGVPEEDVKKGQDNLNTTGTILDPRVRYAMIDEGEKLNPAVQSTLLSLLNPDERFVTIQGKRVYNPNLRSIIYTGNATLPEILEYFQQQGQGSTGPAFLNRFMAKIRVPNWLSKKSQEQIDNMKERRDYLKAIAHADPDALDDMVFQEVPDIDAVDIERFANFAFKLSPEAKEVLNNFVDQLRVDTNKARIESETRHKDDDKEEPYVLTPAVEFSERVRGDLAKWVRVSAALDFLRSPMAEKENIAKYTKHKIELGPLSLWRTWNALTTVESNRTIFDPFTKKIYFESELEHGRLLPNKKATQMEQAKDSTEILELKHNQQAQDRFVNALTTRWSTLKNSLEHYARLLGNDINDIDFENVDFEVALARLGGTDVMKISPDGDVESVTNQNMSQKK